MRRYNIVTGDLENGKLFINHDVQSSNMNRDQSFQKINWRSFKKWIEPGYSKLRKELFEVNLIYSILRWKKCNR